MRTGFAVLIAVVLLLGVLVFWVSSPGEGPSVTEAAPTTSSTSTPTSTSTTATSATTSIPPTSSTTTAPDTTAGHVVETVEEAEEILREHYLRWFGGIFHEDPERIRSTVILEGQVESATSQFGVMEFEAEPTSGGIRFADIQILRGDSECLAIWAEVSATFRDGQSAGVSVFRWTNQGWKLLSSWQFKEDLWEGDCESSL